MVIGDELPTDKETFHQRFGLDFAIVRQEAFDWLKTQELIVFGFIAGSQGMGLDALAVVPANAGFFALALAMLQGIHEMFSFNLYPGPSAKKGVYGMLIDLGEREGWVTAHI